MKQLLRLAIVLALALLVLAPAVQAGDAKTKEGEQTIRGCLGDGDAAGDDWYVLTKKKDDGSTKDVKVAGDESFAAHVGHEVELTGTWVEDESGKHFAASAMKHLAATCS